MQTAYAQKNETTQRAADNTAAAVHDNSPQSESLQRHASLANAAVQRAENPPRPNNTGLPDDLKNGVESLSGYSLDNVRVHYNSPKPATVQALAYTQGTDIHVAPGQEHALPHEAWHVTQQMAGRVSPTTNIGGMPVNDNAALEHEADVMGEKAVTQRKVDGSASSLKSVDLNGGSVQGMPCVCSNGKEKYVTTCKDLLDAFENGEIKTIGDANVDEVNGRARVFKLLKKKENFDLSQFNTLVEKNDKFDGFITGLNKKVINDNLIEMPCYWMNWTAHCTGDLPSMAAAIMMGLPQGIKIKNGGKFKPQDKLNEVASYFGGSIVDDTKVIDSDGFLVATADVKVNSLTVNNGGKKFSWLTNVVATGKYETYDQKGNITYSEKVSNHGLDKDGIGRIKKTWIGDIDGKANAMDTFLDKYGLTPDKLDKLEGKNVEILWIRKSGEEGGAHYENDTSFNAVENYIKTSSQSGKIFILAGDEKGGKAKKIASENADVVYNLTAFWKNESLKETVAAWGGNTRTGQLGIYEYIKNRVGSGSLKHIGSMSGGLEALALIGHEVKYKAKDGEIGVDRVGKYEKERENNAVNYSKNAFFELGKGKETNGYEKRSAKYFNLFSNMSPGFSKNKVIGIYRKKIEDFSLGDDDVYKICFKAFLKNSFLEKLKTSGFGGLFPKTSKTNSQLNGIPQKACVEMAKKFAKAEKSLNENAVNAEEIFESVKIDGYDENFEKVIGMLPSTKK